MTAIKNRIKALLDELVTAATLGSVFVDDFKTNPFEKDIAKYPAAILTTAAVESEAVTNRDNMRAYIFEIVIINKGENVTSATQIETLMDAILDKFDNDPTLAGAADGAVEPSTSTPEAFSTGDKTYIVFSVFLRAKKIKALTF